MPEREQNLLRVGYVKAMERDKDELIEPGVDKAAADIQQDSPVSVYR